MFSRNNHFIPRNWNFGITFELTRDLHVSPFDSHLFFARSGDVCFMGTGSPVGGHVNFEVEDVWGKKLFGKMTCFLLFIKSMCNKTHESLRSRNKKGDVGGAFEFVRMTDSLRGKRSTHLKINMEPKNHPFATENHLNQTFITCVPYQFSRVYLLRILLTKPSRREICLDEH